MHVWFIGLRRALRRTCRQKQCETSFSPFRVFLFSRNSRIRFWGLVVWHLWIGRARRLGPTSLPPHVGVEVLNVGSWLTCEILALGARVDFLAVVEPSLRGSLIAVGRLGVCFLLVWGGSCTWLSCTVSRVLILMLSNLR